MPMMKIFYGVLVLIVLLVIAAFVVPSVIDWNSYKPEISKRVEALTGRSLAIDGDIDIAILPTPKLRISDVRLANIGGATAGDMARLRALDLKLALGPLMSGDFQLSSLKLIDPVIELERLSDGRINWKFEPTDGKPAMAGSVYKGRVGEGGAAFSLDSMSIVNGTLVYRDSALGQVEYIQRLNGTLSAKSLNGPFRGKAIMEVRGLETEFQFAIGSKGADGHMAVSLKAELGDDLAQLGFDGNIAISANGSNGSGTLRMSGTNLTDLIDTLGIGGTGRLLADRFSLKSEVALLDTDVTFDKLQFRVGETQANGLITFAMGTPAQLEATLAINRLDLDKIARNGASAVSEDTRGPASDGDSRDGLADATDQISDYLAMLPQDIAATIDLTIQSLRYRGGVVQRAHTVVSLDDGVITLQQASALLPGGSNFALFGQLSPSQDGPRFDGQVEIESDDVRAVIAWLDLIELDDIPSDRLRRFSLNATISANEQVSELSEIDLAIDASRLKGFAGFTLGTQNRIAANLHLDRLNADAYFGDTDKADAPTNTDAGDATDGRTPAKSGPTFLDKLDAKLTLTAGRLSYGGAIVSDIALEGTLAKKVLTVKRFDIADFSGAKLAMSGEIRDLAGEPDINFAFDSRAESILGFIRVFGIDPNFRADNLGAVHLSGKLSGGREAINLNARLDTRPAKLSLIGSISEPLDNAALNLGLEMRAPDTAELLRAADLAPPKLATRLGALAIDGGLYGGLDALNMSLSARAAGNTLQVAGNLADFSDVGRYDLAFDLANPSFAVLTELLSGKPYDGKKVGEVRIKGRLAGGDVSASLSDFSLDLGKTHISGNADMVLKGRVPVLRANLNAGLLDSGLFIGGAVAGNEGAGVSSGESISSGGKAHGNIGRPTRSPAERWSNEPFNLAPLAEFEGNISVIADTILAGGYPFEQAELKFRVTDGALEIDSLRAHIFDGVLQAQGIIANAEPPQANLAFELKNVNLAAVLHQVGNIDAITGRASLAGRFTSEGYSEDDMVRALQGDATLSATSGTVEGLDLRTLSERLGDLNDPNDFSQLASNGLSGGTTKLDSLDGTIHVRNGLATTTDLTLMADGGRGTVRGNADLPSWQLDLITLFHLADHPKAPPVGMRLTGLIDSPARELLLADMQEHIAKTATSAPVKRKPSFSPQQSELAAEPAPTRAPAQVLKPIPKRADSDPLSPQDILKGVFDILND